MRKKKLEDRNSFFMRFHSMNIYRALLTLSEQSEQPMREIVERACHYAFSSKEFKIPRRETTADKLIAARERRMARLAAKCKDANEK